VSADLYWCVGGSLGKDKKIPSLSSTAGNICGKREAEKENPAFIHSEIMNGGGEKKGGGWGSLKEGTPSFLGKSEGPLRTELTVQPSREKGEKGPSGKH